MRSPAPPSSPTWEDPTARRASRVIGGPMGRYAASASTFWTPVRVMLVICSVTLLLAWAQKSPCANARWAHHRQYSQFCYSDILPLWGTERLDLGAVPYRDQAVEYPVLTGGFLWMSAEIARAAAAFEGTHDTIVVFGVVSVVLLALLGLATLWFTAGAAEPRPWDAAIFAASPLLIFHAFTNWDLLATTLTAAALWAWARRRPAAAGALIGLGAAAKLYPMLLLLPIWVLAVRTRRYQPAAWCTVAAAFAWLAVNLPVAAGYYPGWKEFYVFSANRPAEASTFWQMAHYLTSVGLWGGNPSDWVPPGPAVAVVVVMAVGLVGWLGMNAPVKPRVAQLAFLVVAAFLLTTKVWSPQYSLWLVPLLALARPRWRVSLLWQFSEIAVWMVTNLWLATGSDTATAASRGPTYGWVAVTCLIRDGFLVVLCVLIVREMWNPQLDMIRIDGLDDPGGGPYDNATDHLSAAARQERQMELLYAIEAEDLAGPPGPDPPARHRAPPPQVPPRQ
jgi:uncharacterized membrane protein